MQSVRRMVTFTYGLKTSCRVGNNVPSVNENLVPDNRFRGGSVFAG